MFRDKDPIKIVKEQYSIDDGKNLNNLILETGLAEDFDDFIPKEPWD